MSREPTITNWESLTETIIFRHLGKAAKEFSEKPFLGASLGSMGGKYNDLVYTGMSIYQYIPVYTPGSYLLDLPLRFQ